MVAVYQAMGWERKGKGAGAVAPASLVGRVRSSSGCIAEGVGVVKPELDVTFSDA